jgi:hypothetical protein
VKMYGTGGSTEGEYCLFVSCEGVRKMGRRGWRILVLSEHSINIVHVVPT